MFVSFLQMFVASHVSCFVPSALIIALAGAGPAWAGSFLELPGQWQVIASTRFSTSRLSYDGRGRLTEAAPYRKIEIGWLVEYGLTRNMTLIVNPVVRDVRLETQSGVLAGHGVSSLEAGARWRLLDLGGKVFSFQALVRTPVKADPSFFLENRPRTELRFGMGAPTIVQGRSGFVDVSAAWIKRAESLPDEVKLDVTLGYWPAARRMVMLQHFNSLFPGVSGLGQAPRSHKFEASTVYKLDGGWSVQLGSFASRGGLLTRWEQGATFALWRRF